MIDKSLGNLATDSETAVCMTKTIKKLPGTAKQQIYTKTRKPQCQRDNNSCNKKLKDVARDSETANL